MKYRQMTDTKYNGLTNYETWNWKLWLDNDEGRYNYWQERVKDILRMGVKPRWETVDQFRRSILAEELQADCDERLDLFTNDESGPFVDILNTGISSINWNEIAENLLDE